MAQRFALAHEQLAEEGRRAAQAQERTTLLQERVDTLVRELDQRGGHRASGESPVWKEVLVQATKVAAADTTVLITAKLLGLPRGQLYSLLRRHGLTECGAKASVKAPW